MAASYRLYRITTGTHGTFEVNITPRLAASYLKAGATVQVFTPGTPEKTWQSVTLESAGE